MGYYPDLSHISLDAFKVTLETTELLPSQQILKERIDERFGILKDHKIENMYALQQALKTKDKVHSFANLTSLPVDYLMVLRREINSYHPQARKIRDFLCLEIETREALEKLGIKTTVDLYGRIASKEEREKLKKQLNTTDDMIQLLTKLTDVSRLRYVNQAFAVLLVNTEYDTVEKIKRANYEELYENISKINKAKGYFKGKIGLKDMKFLVNDTSRLILDIEY